MSVGRDDVESRLDRHICRQGDHHTPTRFVPDAEFRLLPHTRGAPLRRYRAHLDEHKITRTISCLPHFLQLDPMVFWTHRDARIPHAAVSHSQVQAICAMVKQIVPECIIATPMTCRAIETALAADGITADFHWYLIVSPDDQEIPSGRLGYKDLQMLPGLSAAYQCTSLARDAVQAMHLSPEYTWEIDDGVALATTKESSPFTLTRYRFAKIREDTACPCGEKRYAIL